IDRECFQRADPRIGMGKEQLCEDETGDGRIEEEVVPFDRGADGRSDHGAAKLHLMFTRGERDGIRKCGCHGGCLLVAPKPNVCLLLFLLFLAVFLVRRTRVLPAGSSSRPKSLGLRAYLVCLM